MAAASPPPPEIMNLKPDNIEPDDPQASVSGDISLLPAADPPASITPPSVTPSADLTHPAAETVNLSTDSTPAAAPTPAAPAVVTPPPHPVAPSFTPSFRPLAPQFSPVTPNPAFPSHTFTPQNPSIQPPGVTQPPGSIPPPGAVSGAGTMPVSVAPVPPPGVYYHHAPAQPPAHMPYWQPPPNGYMTVPAPSTQPPGMIPPPGIPRYPALYPGVGRPIFPPRPPASVGVVPTISRPPVPATGAPIVPPLLRPVGPVVPPTEKPQTTVYVGKIASTVDNEYIKSLLGLCGPVKSWKRPSDGNGTPRGFGFCEFESAEGVLRALRLLSKLNVDGQELVLNVNQATREYLERYIAKKTEREKMKETEDDAVGRDTGVSDADKQEPQKTDSNKDADTEENKKEDDPQNFGIVTDEDRNADKEALEKVKHMIEERLKTNPLPPPPPVSANADGGAMSNSELATKSKNGETDANGLKNAEEKNDDDVSSENKISSENDRAEGDRARRRGRSREREREYDIKREKEREVERYERDRERERLRRERERDHKIRETERLYKDRLKEWEAREREKEHQRHYEKEREKERESKRRREVSLQEDESDDDDGRKRRHRSSVLEERRRRRLREKEDDLADRRREEEEIAEARKRAVEEEKQKVDSKSSVISTNGTMEPEIQRVSPQENIKDEDDSEPAADSSTPMIIENLGDAVSNIDESLTTVVSTSEAKRNGSIPSRKLGFGLIGSGKKTTVPSVFHEEDDDELNKDKKMRPLVPIDYSTEELQAVQRTTSDSSPNLVAAAEYAKRISGGSFKEEKSLSDKDRRRTSDRHRVRNEDDSRHSREEGREQAIDRVSEQREREKDDKPKMTENKKLLDAKQLIDMIPKTKEELFSYDINWAVYDKHDLHERMRPWISKKITEFLGEEEPSLVDYIVSSTNSHMQASEMLDLLQSILDEEAEMFVLKMWRMLIFEIKKVEKGLSSKLKA